MITIEGTVEEIIYTNESNGFTVCDIDYKDALVTAVGYMPYINEAETVKLVGKWVIHKNYGEQFKVEYFEKVLPCTASMIYKYLASGAVKGIREATAKKIIDTFGDKALEVMEKSPEKLAEIKGISKKKAVKLGQAFMSQNEVRNIVMFLQQYGVGMNYAVKIHKRFGAGAIKIIKENPYVLCEEIYGIGFKTADKIAITLGMDFNSTERIKAGAKYTLMFASVEGHTFLPRDVLVKKAAGILNVTCEEVDNTVVYMLINKSIVMDKVNDEERIYLTSFHKAEINVARKLMQLSFAKFENSGEDIDKRILDIQDDINIKLTDKQAEAVKQAVCNGVMVITGGPGTGKTTIINAIIKLMEQFGYSISLAAPTGRAAKRMSEMTGKEAKTIHRLLEIGYNEEDSEARFLKDESEPLDADVVIIDEMSMMDILLMNHLVKAVKDGTRLILVGDVDQLPSVGPGNVLKDIISSGVVKVVKLTEIFRQAKESMIIVNAHNVNKGKYPLLNVKDKDFYFASRHSASEIVPTIVDMCENRLPNFYGYNPVLDIQVLSPMKKSPVGVINLNNELQRALNPPSKNKNEKSFRNIIFRENDKVMQIKNNYDLKWKSSDGGEGLGVFNGDIGYIQKIDNEKETMSVIFDEDRKVEYQYSQLDELELSYAMTVHKSQGSEFPVVVMCMYQGPPKLLSRNLFYTAITRAKKLVVLVGYEQVIKHMVDNNKETKRYSALGDKMREII